MGLKLPNPPDAVTPFTNPAWQTWFQLLFRLFGNGNLGNFLVANLPNSPVEGQFAYASNGRKVGETAGNGTGVPIYYSKGFWRVFSTDSAVTV